MPDIICPKCGSADVIFSKKKQIYICEEEECRHEFLPEKKITPLRVFISYGRDEYALLARRLKDDLVKRGHEVWFDSERLKEGGDWERYIDEGLNHVAKDITTGRVVFIMTPHSTRRPDGYCLNELARALSKSLPIVPLMLVYSEPPLSICRLQYLDMQDSYPPDEKTVTYEQRFERLISALEENRIDFEGFQGRLLAALDPIKFHADIAKLLRDFTGRKWVIEEVDKWYADPEGSKIFWLTGAPGTGKSAVAAWIRDNRREIAAYHFCDINSEEKRDAGKLVRSVAYQLSTQLPQYEEKLKSLPVQEIANEYHEAYTLFDKLIVQPLTENFPDPGRTVVVLIDALDEATYKGNNEIVRFLSRCADKTPAWLRFLVTSRPEQEITSSLQALSPHLLDTDTEANRNDIREYLKKQLQEITAEQTARIIERSEGVFLYVKHVCDEIKAKRLSLDRIDEFPRGLGEIYKQFFDNRILPERIEYYNQEVRPLLCAVLASFEPLTLGHLIRLLKKKNLMELFDVTDTLGSLFPRTGDNTDDTISPFHRSIKDWITVKASAGVYFIDEQYGHKLLAEDGWKQYEADVEKIDDYSLVWLPLHLDEVEEHEKLVTVLKNFEFIMARVKAGHLERMLEDYREIVKKLPPDFQKQLRIEEAFFREKAHILRRGNNEWPAFKILFQLAIEHADDSPVTIGAEKYLQEGKCDWVWLRREKRLDIAGVDACIYVFESHSTHVEGAIELKDKRILSWSRDKTLCLWDRLGRLLVIFKGHMKEVYGALERRNGQILSWSADNTLRLWDNDGNLLNKFEGHSNTVNGAVETLDGGILSWSKDKTLRIWKNDGTQHAVIEGHLWGVTGAIEMPDEKILSWSEDNTLRLWDKVGNQLSVFEGHSDRIYGAKVVNSQRILSWSADGTLRLWDRDGNILSVFEGHTKSIAGAFVLSDGRILSWALDNTLRIWTRSGELVTILKGHTVQVDGALELSDGRILSWAWDNTLRLWDRTGEQLCILDGHSAWVFGALELSSHRILSWSSDHTLRLWDKDGHQLAVFSGHSDSVYGARELADGHILSWSVDSTLRLWNEHGSQSKTLEGHSDFVTGLIELTNGKILSWSQDYTMILWDWGELKILSFSRHAGWIHKAIELSDHFLLSWSDDKTLCIWNQDGNTIAELKGHNSLINGALELLDGRIISWAWDRTLRIWDRDGNQLNLLVGHADSVNGAFELSNGKILSWSDDKTLRLWSNNGTYLTRLDGHISRLRGAQELSSSRILSWSNDKTLRLWNVDGSLFAVLAGHTGNVLSAQELTDGHIISWSDDNTLRIWDRDGLPIAVCNIDKALFLYPEAREMIFGKNCVFSHSWLRSQDNSVVLIASKSNVDVFWHGVSKCTARLLKPDGSAIVTQANGQVCFLKL